MYIQNIPCRVAKKNLREIMEVINFSILYFKVSNVDHKQDTRGFVCMCKISIFFSLNKTIWFSIFQYKYRFSYN